MKRFVAILCVVMIVASCISTIALADPGDSLEDVIAKSNTEETTETTDTPVEQNTSTATTPETQNNTDANNANNANAQNNQGSSQQDYNNEYINKLTGSNNLTDVDLPGVDAVTDGAKQIAGWIVQVLSYVIIAFLAVRTLIDLAYITIPFTRTFLANGYTGQPQSSTQTPMAGSMNNGMMGGPMGGGMYGNRYGGGMYGNSGGMYGNTGMYGNAGMTNQMLGQNSMMNRNSSMLGNVQFVTNAALNAVATESTVGSDGKTQNAFKIYAKDMMVTLIIVPILVLLAATGVVTQLGFAIGGFLVDAVRGISGKIGNM